MTKQTKTKKVKGFALINADKITAPKIKARFVVDYESVTDLTESIRKIGLIQPLVVKQRGEKFEVVAGHRRLIACRLAKLDKIMCMVIEKDSNVEDTVKLHENLMREDLSAVEEAAYIRYLVEKKKKSQREIAEILGMSEGYVSQRLSMLSWSVILLDAVDKGQISFTAARELARITDEDALLIHVNQAIESGVTPRVANIWVRDWLASKNYDVDGHQSKDSQIKSIDNDSTKFSCGMCGDVLDYRELIYTRLCRGCHGAMVTAQEELQKVGA